VKVLFRTGKRRAVLARKEKTKATIARGAGNSIEAGNKETGIHYKLTSTGQTKQKEGIPDLHRDGKKDWALGRKERGRGDIATAL